MKNTEHMNHTQKKRVLILGGGFGGIYAALHLEKTLARRDDLEVTLVNRDNYFLFTPMLHEVAASDLDPVNIVNPAHKLLKHVRFVAGDVTSINASTKCVTMNHAYGHHTLELDYDYLVLALGSVTNFHNLPGIAERALAMKTLTDAAVLRSQLIGCLEEADFEIDEERRRRLLTFLVVGGGFAGVETVGGINDFVREALRFYPRLDEKMLRVVLVQRGKGLLPEFDDELGGYTERKLSARGVEIKTNTTVKKASDAGIELGDDSRIDAGTLVWTAGVAPNPLVATLPCETHHGRIVTNEYMEVVGLDGVWALGDCAAVPDKHTGKPYAPLAQNAQRQGTRVGENIVAAMDGSAKRAFTYRTMGQLASIGKRSGVADILGVKFSGRIAWILWRTYYLLALPRFEKKLGVVLNWMLDFFFSKDLVQFISSDRLRQIVHQSQEIEATPASSANDASVGRTVSKAKGATL